MNVRAAAALVAMVSLAQPLQPAQAGACGTEVDAFKQSLQHQSGAVGTAPQSVDAQLRHQPTPASVAGAKQEAKGDVEALLTQAKTYDSRGKQDECAHAFAKAKLLANP